MLFRTDSCVLEWQSGGDEWSDNWTGTERQSSRKNKSLVNVDSWEGDSWSNEEWVSPTAETTDRKQEKEKSRESSTEKEDKKERRQKTQSSREEKKETRSEAKAEEETRQKKSTGAVTRMCRS